MPSMKKKMPISICLDLPKVFDDALKLYSTNDMTSKMSHVCKFHPLTVSDRNFELILEWLTYVSDVSEFQHLDVSIDENLSWRIILMFLCYDGSHDIDTLALMVISILENSVKGRLYLNCQNTWVMWFLLMHIRKRFFEMKWLQIKQQDNDTFVIYADIRYAWKNNLWSV